MMLPAQVHIQGAGQVDIYAALTYGLTQRLVPSSMSFGAWLLHRMSRGMSYRQCTLDHT